MPVKINSSGGGSVTLDVPSTSTANTLILPAKTGNIITSADSNTVTQAMMATGVTTTGPAFGAYQSVAQSALGASTWTKLVLQTEEFDTASCFDNATNYRFIPNVAGYYQLNGIWHCSTSTTSIGSAIYKNGSLFRQSYMTVSATNPGMMVSSLVYLNGTTDYVELWGFVGTSQAPLAGANYTYFNGFLARAA